MQGFWQMYKILITHKNELNYLIKEYLEEEGFEVYMNFKPLTLDLSRFDCIIAQESPKTQIGFKIAQIEPFKTIVLNSNMDKMIDYKLYCLYNVIDLVDFKIEYLLNQINQAIRLEDINKETDKKLWTKNLN